MIGALLAPQEPWLEELYSKISRELDLAARIRSLNRKLDYAHQVCDGVCACVCCIVGALRAGCWCALAGLRVDGVGVFQCDLILSPLDCMDDVCVFCVCARLGALTCERERVCGCMHTHASTHKDARAHTLCMCMYVSVCIFTWMAWQVVDVLRSELAEKHHVRLVLSVSESVCVRETAREGRARGKGEARGRKGREGET